MHICRNGCLNQIFLILFDFPFPSGLGAYAPDYLILFRNVFINSIIAKGCSYDKTEKYLRILEQMNCIELLLLKILKNPKVYNEKQGGIIKNPNERQSNAVYRSYILLQ